MIGVSMWAFWSIVFALMLCVWVLIWAHRLQEKNNWYFTRNWRYTPKVDRIRKQCLIAALFFALVGALQLQWGMSEESIEYKGLDILWALDVSKSMRALDFSNDEQSVDRLSVAKEFIDAFVEKRSTDRFGLVLFAGNSFVSVPLTFDRSLFRQFLRESSENDVSRGGTNLQEAIGVSLERLTVQDEEERGRAIILVTDGDQTENNDIRSLVQMAQTLRIPIFTIGIGSTSGVRIPEGRDVFGRMVYIQHEGYDVVTKLNEDVLRMIARGSGGEYVHADSLDDIEKVSSFLDELPVSVYETWNQTQKEERYQIFLVIALIFLCSSLFFPFDKS